MIPIADSLREKEDHQNTICPFCSKIVELDWQTCPHCSESKK